MSLAVVGLVVLGCLLFIVYTLVNYVEEASPIQAKAQELLTDAEAKRKRAADYQARVDALREVRPELDVRVKVLQHWISLLKAQKAHIESTAPQGAGPEREKRAAAVRAGMSNRWMGTR